MRLFLASCVAFTLAADTTLTSSSTFVLLDQRGACCRHHPSLRLSGTSNNYAYAPRDCEPLCLRDERCRYFSHSTHWKNCMTCSDCAAVQSDDARYTSWRRRDDVANPLLLARDQPLTLSRAALPGLCPRQWNLVRALSHWPPGLLFIDVGAHDGADAVECATVRCPHTCTCTYTWTRIVGPASDLARLPSSHV